MMNKDKAIQDTISENEYTLRMKSASTRPEDDSPGDSEADAGAEFEMGLEYLPDAEDDSAEPVEEALKHPIKKIPESALVIASELPAPWMDLNKNSSTN
jgi:hypothetical protein